MRNGIKIYVTLKPKTKLKIKGLTFKKRKPIKQMSDKQKVKTAKWNELTDIKAEQENYICEWCQRIGSREKDSPIYLDGHHIERRNAGNFIMSNLYVVHRYNCHRFITDNNVKCYEFANAIEWNKAHPENQFKII
jgi:hypothetical protein